MALLQSRAPRTAYPHPCASVEGSRDEQRQSSATSDDGDTVMKEACTEVATAVTKKGIATNTSTGTNRDTEEGADNSHVARAGDVVIIQEHYTTLKAVTLKSGGFLNNRYGRFSHDDILGRNVGRRIKAQNPAMKTAVTSSNNKKGKGREKEKEKEKGGGVEKEVEKEKDEAMKDKHKGKEEEEKQEKDKNNATDVKKSVIKQTSTTTAGKTTTTTTTQKTANNNTATKRQLGAGFVHVLAPTPELWSQAMEHRTQIVYPHDAAVIALQLELRPGDVLVECGTGSGSATVAFARIVAPHGRIYTYDFHAQRGEKAREDFNKLGLDEVVQVFAGIDVLKDGFKSMKDNSVDAVFLDLPMPYEMGKELYRVLKCNGKVCLFSPCVEQVQKSCEMLRKDGCFHTVRTVTCPVKTYETREMKLETPGFDQLRGDVEVRREMEEEEEKKKVKKNGNGHFNEDDNNHDDGEPPPSKRMRSSDKVEGPISTEQGKGTATATATATGAGKDCGNAAAAAAAAGSEKWHRLRSRTAGAERLAIAALEGHGKHVGRVIRPNIRLHSKPFPTMKGHTSYLTFARKSNTLSDEDIEENAAANGGEAVEKGTKENEKDSTEKAMKCHVS